MSEDVTKLRAHHINFVNAVSSIIEGTNPRYNSFAEYAHVLESPPFNYSRKWFNEMVEKVQDIVETNSLVKIVVGESDLLCENCNGAGCNKKYNLSFNREYDTSYLNRLKIKEGSTHKIKDLIQLL